jgi:hypothetical protein
MSAGEWVLAYEGDNGRVTYFETWTAIGPCGTWNISDAERFATEHDAMRSPAYSHALSFYAPKRVPDAS